MSRFTIDNIGVIREEGNSYIVDSDAFAEFLRVLLNQAGVPEADARVVSDSLVEADLRGMNSHGIIRLPVYIRRLRAGGFKADAVPEVIRESDGVALLDGKNGLGSVMTMRAMSIAIEKAKTQGIAACGVTNSNHNGEGAFYVQEAIRHDMIGMSFTTGSPIMPVWGGTTPLTGPLPITVGVPADKEHPIVLDAALGMSSRGKILDYLAQGKELPPGWIVDANGEPTTDPKWVNEGGWILPIGGHKGWGLIVICEMLAAVLTGSGVGKELVNLYDDVDTPQGNGQFVIAIDVSHFMPVNMFKSRVDNYIKMVKSSDKAEGVEEIILPGEKEFKNRERAKLDGMKLTKSVLDEVISEARIVGVFQ
ncbi:Ldh family oxidoreductase [Aquibaculum sediminis]|uniref:Ldh family oxidoreductase n=1 Tax=Aquibaculum sediminis TaxID=3231907 RepID=UPI003453798A